MLKMKAVYVFLGVLIGLVLSRSAAFAQSEGERIPVDSFPVYRTLSPASVPADSVFRIDLSKQKRTEVPEELRKFKNLRELKLNKNGIDFLPAWIGEFEALEVLDISSNRLRALPPEIGNLSSLINLQANRNLLETLPHEIGQLTQLEMIGLWDNEIVYLPDEMKMLKNLKVLELRGILFNEEEQNQIRELLPQAEVFLSPPCHCAQ